MKKSITFKILVSSLFFISWPVMGQVGIGTTTPRGALDINNPTSFNMPLVLPANVSADNMINPQGGAVVPGSLMFDSTLDCIRLYQQNNGNGAPGWSTCIGAGESTPTSVASINCNNPTNTGNVVVNEAVSPAVTFTINYTGGNGSSYPQEVVNSTGIEGLTATRIAGNFNNGNGSVTYTITGTAISTGTAIFPITIGGISCNVSRSVILPPPVPAPTIIANCSGFMLPYRTNNTTAVGTVSGLPVTTTFNEFVNIGTLGSNVDCGIATFAENTFWLGGGDNVSSMSIKFDRPVSNLKVFQTASIGTTNSRETFFYTLKRNGVDVTPTSPITRVYSGSCAPGQFNIFQNRVRCDSTTQAGVVYSVGGVWFDEVVISAIASVGNGSIFNFCIGNTY